MTVDQENERIMKARIEELEADVKFWREEYRTAHDMWAFLDAEKAECEAERDRLREALEQIVAALEQIVAYFDDVVASGKELAIYSCTRAALDSVTAKRNN
jgi:predicted  nucleic acid-binding Zn-ribbon protein